jgi:hypothetical protein
LDWIIPFSVGISHRLSAETGCKWGCLW